MSKCFSCSIVVAEAQKASNDVLQQADRLHLHQASYHVAQHCSDSVESFVCGADVVESSIVEKYLLHNENCDRLGEFTTGLHDTKA